MFAISHVYRITQRFAKKHIDTINNTARYERYWGTGYEPPYSRLVTEDGPITLLNDVIRDHAELKTTIDLQEACWKELFNESISTQCIGNETVVRFKQIADLDWTNVPLTISREVQEQLRSFVFHKFDPINTGRGGIGRSGLPLPASKKS